MAGFSRIWTPAFGLINKLLYEATKGPDSKSLLCNREQEKVFNDINRPSLTKAPALGLPSLNKPFILYGAEKQGTPLGAPSSKARGSSSAHRLFLQANRFHGLRLAWLPPGSRCHHSVSGRSSRAYLWTATSSPDPPPPSSAKLDSGDQRPPLANRRLNTKYGLYFLILQQ